MNRMLPYKEYQVLSLEDEKSNRLNELRQKTYIQMNPDGTQEVVKAFPEFSQNFLERWNRDWEKLESKIQEGDEVWFAQHQFAPLNGWGGYIVVRKDENGNENVVGSNCTWIS